MRIKSEDVLYTNTHAERVHLGSRLDQYATEPIYMRDIDRVRQSAYFCLPAIGEAPGVKEVANLALCFLLDAKQNSEALTPNAPIRRHPGTSR